MAKTKKSLAKAKTAAKKKQAPKAAATRKKATPKTAATRKKSPPKATVAKNQAPLPKKKAPAKAKAPPKKAPKTENEPTTIEFLMPSGDCSTLMSPQSLKEGVFPPTIYSDAIYSRGIRMFPDSGEEKPQSQCVSLSYTCDYIDPLTTAVKNRLNIPKSLPYSYNKDSVPVMAEQDARLWMHKRAARSAVQQHFPIQIFRLLGTITREVTVMNDLPNGPFTHLAKYSPNVLHTAPDIDQKVKPSRMTIQAAMKEAQAEAGESVTDAELNARAAEIQLRWNQKVQQGLRRKGWDKHGQLPREAVNDDQYVPLTRVRDWLKRQHVVDPSPSHTSLYNGLRSIPNDLESIVASLLELASPEGLFNVPLVLPYAVMEIVEESSSGAAKATPSPRGKPPSKKQKTESSVQRKWKIRIGVYANRLLPEVMTSHDLHIVMTALDEGSFRVVEPLHLPPSPEKPVFESAPSPVVVMGDESEVPDMYDSDGEEKKSDDVVDLTIGESTRDESRISAFSVNGFLKLLESRGNDISNWPEIEPAIASVLKLKLMLHQQHAICWMLQMESLGGYGINSIIWEERTFLDGGRYFYSPALGQMRLAPPPVMKGGILADSMGLGKTLEVLGLIVASLEDLKREATEAAKHCKEDDLIPTHATLIIVPPALVSQWKSEIRKATGDALVVQCFNPKTLTFESDKNQEEDEDPDIVITTYSALSANNSSRTLSSFAWGRICLDEMQELRVSTTKISKNCDKLSCRRRWMISGTPLFEGFEDLRGELNFLQLEPYAARLEDGFFDFSITNHLEQHSLHGLETLRILGMLMLRRSKTMTIAESGHPLLGLKPLTVEFLPVPQDPSERAVYCFLESIVSRVLNGDAKNASSRAKCLAILREMCISGILLSGGMGSSSQLATLNMWLEEENRIQMGTRVSRAGTSTSLSTGGHSFPFSCHTSTFSCEEAIQHLSSAQAGANVGDDFVSDTQLGFGGGGSNRNRAADNFAIQLKEAEDEVNSLTNAIKSARSKKAKALWHSALEKITTGQIGYEQATGLRPSVMLVWKMRSAVIWACENDLAKRKKLPMLLVRGWRPAKTFLGDLFEKHPTFAWAHPFSYQLDAIPSTVLPSEVKDSILTVLLGEDDDCEITGADEGRVTVVSSHSTDETWKAVVQFASNDDLQIFRKKAGGSNGIELASKEISPQLKAAMDSTKVVLEEAEAEDKVLPSTASNRKVSAAKKAHEKVLKGLRIVLRSAGVPYHLRASVPSGISREAESRTDISRTVCKSVDQCNRTIVALEEGRQKVSQLRRRLSRQVPEGIAKLSVFDILCALSQGENDKTMCPICLCHLGVSVDTNGDERKTLVAMTHCGHVFCASCLKDAAEKRQRPVYTAMQCPSCRRPIEQSRPVIMVDTEKTEDRDLLVKRRQEAKSLVQRVAKLLDESNGQLDPQIWHQLYLSIDLPPNVDASRCSRFRAIPPDLLAHLRAATNIRMGASKSEMPNASVVGAQAGLSSKVRALLADLPREERSVVFSESRAAVTHLMFVLEKAGIGCRALFSSEAVSAQEVALQDWKSASTDESGNEAIPFPVLIVQAGAASCGLTLTAASKMFLMEPFTRMEEEQQAYARCHRYGQEHAVHVKCYYAPCSVESRLMDWRKRAAERPSGATTDTKIVYSPIAANDDDGTSDDDEAFIENETAAEEDRTRFLLGLTGEEGQNN